MEQAAFRKHHAPALLPFTNSRKPLVDMQWKAFNAVEHSGKALTGECVVHLLNGDFQMRCLTDMSTRAKNYCTVKTFGRKC